MAKRIKPRDKRVKAQTRQRDRVKRRTRQVCQVMAALGLRDEFQKLGEPVHQIFRRIRLPAPSILVGGSAQSAPETKPIVIQTQRLLDRTTFKLESNGTTLSFTDFISYGLAWWLRFSRFEFPEVGYEDLDRFITLLGERTQQHIYGEVLNALSVMVGRLEETISDYSRLDKRLFYIEPVWEVPAGKLWTVRFALECHTATPKMEWVEGVRKPLYRCGSSFGMHLDWVSWSPEVFGVRNVDRRVPVYVDRHTLNRFRERMVVDPLDDTIEDYIWQSLREPVVVQQDGDTLLVECRVFDYKVGYFVVKVLGDKAVTMTFLFLTMDGTPEGNLLRRRLGINRHDKRYTEVDSLRTFLRSDIRHDPGLVRVFTESGCGDLFALAPGAKLDKSLRGTADDIRHYLGGKLSRLLTRIQQTPPVISNDPDEDDSEPSFESLKDSSLESSAACSAIADAEPSAAADAECRTVAEGSLESPMDMEMPLSELPLEIAELSEPAHRATT
ncbi:MAG: hypothetical protein KDA47_18635 [Planctomycetales bacterium]|nr:hypothetical protein [Planctomycetales bacterium]